MLTNLLSYPWFVWASYGLVIVAGVVWYYKQSAAFKRAAREILNE